MGRCDRQLWMLKKHVSCQAMATERCLVRQKPHRAFLQVSLVNAALGNGRKVPGALKEDNPTLEDEWVLNILLDQTKEAAIMLDLAGFVPQP